MPGQDALARMLASMVVVATFGTAVPCALADDVASVEIEVKKPFVGGQLEQDATIVETFPLDAKDYFKVTDVTWVKDGETIDPLDGQAPQRNDVYHVKVTLEATGDYTFSDATTYLVNDGSCLVDEVTSESTRTIEAEIKLPSYTVTYHRNAYNSPEDSECVTEDSAVSTLTLSALPEQWGDGEVKFVCWSTEPWSIDNSTFPQTIVASGRQYASGALVELSDDLDLYAQWIVGAGNALVFDANLPGSTSPALVAMPVPGVGTSYEQTLIDQAAEGFVREGFKIKEFNVRPDGTGQSFAPDTLIDPVDASVVLYAIWEEGPAEEVQDQEPAQEQAETVDERVDETVVAEVEVDALAAEEMSPELLETSLLSLTTTSDSEAYTVRYDANGGTGTGGSVEKVDNVSGSYVLRGPDFTRDGYRLVGWSFDANTNPNSNALVHEGEVIDVESDVTLYAIWEEAISAYKISFDANGGTNAPSDRTIDGGTDYRLPNAEPTYSGYAFTGWRDSDRGQVFQAGDDYGNVFADVTFTAQWADACTITFDANGGSGSMDDYIAAKGTPFTLPINKFTRSGYAFQGWSTDEKDESAEYLDREMNVSFTNDTTLHAVWKEDSSSSSSSSRTISSTTSSSSSNGSLTIRYNSNGGSGSMDSQSVAEGDSITLAEPEFTRDGYTFTGWNTSQSGSGTSYKAGESLSPTSNLTLYAQWSSPDGEAAPSSTSGRTISTLDDVQETESSASSTSSATDEDDAKSARRTTPESPAKTADPTNVTNALIGAGAGAALVMGALALKKKRAGE